MCRPSFWKLVELWLPMGGGAPKLSDFVIIFYMWFIRANFSAVYRRGRSYSKAGRYIWKLYASLSFPGFYSWKAAIWPGRYTGKLCKEPVISLMIFYSNVICRRFLVFASPPMRADINLSCLLRLPLCTSYFILFVNPTASSLLCRLSPFHRQIKYDV